MKICVVGGGSTYTPELVDGLLRRAAALPVRELVLLDPDAAAPRDRRRLRAAHGRGGRLGHARALDGGCRRRHPRLGLRRLPAARRRAGGAPSRRAARARVRADRAGDDGRRRLREGAPHDPGDARDRARSSSSEAPEATLVNFTNPAGLITELLRRHTPLRVIGLCNVPWNMRVDLAAELGVAVERVELDYVGLNHLSWVRALARRRRGSHGGDAGARPRRRRSARRRRRRSRLLAGDARPARRCCRATTAATSTRRPRCCGTRSRHPTRASEVMEIERRLLLRYEDPSRCARSRPS